MLTQILNAIVSAIFSRPGISIIEFSKWLAFVPAFVLATIAVVVGLYWESEKFIPTVQKRGKKLLLVALIIEAVSGGLTIGSDGIISQSQERTVEQMLSHRILSREQREQISSTLAPYPAGDFFTFTDPEDEPWGFVMDIAATLTKSGWVWRPCTNVINGSFPMQPLDGRPASCSTIASGIEIHASPDFEKLAGELADAIREPSVIGMDNVQVILNPRLNNRLIIIVGSKR
jgi:hypothetical protein